MQQMTHECRVLRRVLARRVGREASDDERSRLDEAMDFAVAGAVARFSEARERSLVIEVERSRLALEAADLGATSTAQGTVFRITLPRGAP